MLCVCDLPVVKIAWLLISFWNWLHVFYLLFVRLWGVACNLLKIMNNRRGWLCVCSKLSNFVLLGLWWSNLLTMVFHCVCKIELIKIIYLICGDVGSIHTEQMFLRNIGVL